MTTSQLISLTAQAQDSLVTSVFGFTIGDDIVLSSSSGVSTLTLQRRPTEGSIDWVDTSVSVAVSTTDNTVIDAITLKSHIGVGNLFRFRLSDPVRLWVGIDSATSEFLLGSSALPMIRPPASNRFVSVPYLPSEAFSSLQSGSVVLLFMGGQSIWQGIEQYTGSYPVTSKYWDGTELKVIDSANGYRTTAAPTIGLALEFERKYPGLELWIAEDGEGGTGFHDNKWETGGSLRESFLMKLTSALMYATSQNRDIYFAGTVWNQGTADSYQPFSAVYQTALAGLVTDINGITNLPQRFITTRGNAPVETFGDIGIIRAVHESYTFVDIDDIQKLPDDLHYGVEESMEIGRRQLDKLNTFSIERISTFVPVPPSLTELWDFGGLSALPAGFSTVKATPVFQGGYTQIDREDPNDWATSYLRSPALDLEAYDISITFISQGWGAVSISSNYEAGLFSGADGLAVTKGGAVFLNGNSSGNVGAQITGTTYEVKFSRTGTAITVTNYDVTNDSLVGTLALPSVPLVDPRVFIDSAYTNQRVVQIKEVTK